MMVPITKRESVKSQKKNFFKKALFVLLGISVLFIATAMIISNTKDRTENTRQAVFMSSGTVYFGFVKDKSESMIEIDDVYYITSIQSLYPAQPEQEKISLIKMGNEVYKPENKILVNKDQIFAIQGITQDSQINKAILDSLAKK